MTQDEIIRMAREAGLGDWVHPNNTWYVELERFAALVAAHEREKATEYRLKLENVLAGCEAAVLAEREACAKVCEETPWSNWFQSDCARAIRARSK